MNSDKFWDSVAKDYKSNVITPFYNNESKSALFKALDNLQNGDKPNKILEIGCGKGYLLKLLSSYARDVTAIDFSKNMLKYARAKNKHKSVKIIKADSNEIPSEDNYFDQVYSINSILSTNRDERTNIFSEIRRVLKPNGKFFALFPSTESYLEQSYVMREKAIEQGLNEISSLKLVYDELTKRDFDPVGGVIRFVKNNKRFKIYSRFELEDILGKSGFKKIRIQAFKYPESMCKELNLAYGKNRIYDWLVSVEKKC